MADHFRVPQTPDEWMAQAEAAVLELIGCTEPGHRHADYAPQYLDLYRRAVERALVAKGRLLEPARGSSEECEGLLASTVLDYLDPDKEG